ncbi:MAG: L-2-hydroxyglutarate oxidase [Planctomycetota bacterium]|nr:MAG: L-2-hydroxyglutarate oxidase [Planctomycetota bacterium]
MYDLTIIGGGILGLATAREFLIKYPNLKLILLEKESTLAFHQSGRNSGVIHSGIYYKPNSLKAKLCVEGAEKMFQYCAENNIPHKKIGKIIVATKESELNNLETIFKNGIANGVKDLALINQEQVSKIEPKCKALRAIHCPHTGIADYKAVCNSMANDIKNKHGEILLNHKVIDLKRIEHAIHLKTDSKMITTENVITCGGAHSDKLAILSGGAKSPKIIPFRGSYLLLKKDAESIVNGLIYPVPDPKFPFLGVHFTPQTDGRVWLGPNAVLAFAIEGYRFSTINIKELLSCLFYPGMIKLMLKYWRTGILELYRDLSKKEFLKSLQKFIPEITLDQCEEGPSGIRAQALNYDGTLVDDFVLETNQPNIFHVRNAPSPAATSSLSIAEMITVKAAKHFEL